MKLYYTLEDIFMTRTIIRIVNGAPDKNLTRTHFPTAANCDLAFHYFFVTFCSFDVDVSSHLITLI